MEDAQVLKAKWCKKIDSRKLIIKTCFQDLAIFKKKHLPQADVLCPNKTN